MIIGKIVAIDYSKLKVRISTEVRGNSVNIRGELYYFGNIGGYLKTFNAVGETIVCEVTSILDSDPQKDKQSFNMESDRELILKPIGTLTNKKFDLGVGIYPSLYSDVEILTNKDMSQIMNTTTEAPSSQSEETVHRSFYMGKSKNLINYPIHININKFFNIHSAVLGNSGSGKSNTIAHILQEILKKQKLSAIGAKFILFDVNGEYKNAFPGSTDPEGITIKHFKPPPKNDEGTEYETFTLPHFLLNLDEWCGFLLATEATQRPFWDRVLQESIRFYLLTTASEKDTEFIHYFIHRVCTMVDNVLSQVDSDTSRMTSVNGLLGRIEALIAGDEELKSKAEITCFDSENMSSILNKLRKNASLSYGDNDNALLTEIKRVAGHINKEKVNKILNEKYKQGAWYSFDFLKIAAEICLMEEDSRGSKNMRNWTSTLMTRLDYFLENHECEFMRGKSKGANSAECYLKTTFGIEEDKNNQNTQLIIIDTSGLSPDVLETLTSVTARLIFDHRRASKDRNKNPVHLILDEAHRYVKKHQNYLLKENIFEKIAREGRKYSYYLLLSSQRPSEVSETVLSQCGNYIIHRIQNDEDMRYIKAIMPFFSQDFVDKIKQAVAGEATVFGNCVPMPLQINIEKSNPEPNSKNCNISEEWFKKAATNNV